MKRMQAFLRGKFAGSGAWARVSRLRAGKLRRRLLVLLIVLVAIVALLPTIVAKTPLFSILMARVVPAQLRVNVGSVSLGWFSAPAVSQLAVQDADGGKLLEVESLQFDRSLLALATHPHDLGVVEITRPTLFVSLHENGSNVEDALRPLLAQLQQDVAQGDSAKPKNSNGTRVSLRVVDGVMLTSDEVRKRQWRLVDCDLQLDSPGGASGLGQLSASGQLDDGQPQAGDIGRFAVSLAPVAGAESTKTQLSIQMKALPLAALEPLLRRGFAGAEIGGTLSGQGGASWTPGDTTKGLLPSDLQATGQLWIDGLDATAEVLAGDRVRLARVELPWRINSVANTQGQHVLTIEDLQLRSDVGELALRGTIDAAAERPDVEARGKIDLARLAAMLPHALRIREGTTLTSGRIELALHEQPAVGGQQLSGGLRAVELAGTSGGRALRWDSPISANFALRRGPVGVLVDSLQCTSDFLNVDASGDANQVTASARFDLNRLAGQLGQFIDLSGMEMTGTGTAGAQWQLAGGTKFSLTANGDLAQLRVGRGDGALWAEPQLSVRSSVTGALDATTRRLVRVDEAWAKVAAQGDQLDARLVSAVDIAPAPPAEGQVPREQPAANEPIWPVNVRVVGGAGRWLTRARPVLDISPWQVDGQTELTANVRIRGSVVESNGVKLTIANLQAVGAGWAISEPRVELTADARFDGATGAFACDTGQLVTSTVSMQAKGLRFGAGQLGGAAAFRADVTRLAAWRGSTAGANGGLPSAMPSGQITGNVVLAEQAGRLVGELTLTGDNLALSQVVRTNTLQSVEFQTVWKEPKLTVRCQAAYDRAADRLALDNLNVESNTLAAAFTGQIDRLSTAAETKLNGTLNYDLAQITPLLQPYFGKGIQLTGREQARFAVAGKLSSAAVDRETLAYVSQTSPAGVAGNGLRGLQARIELPWSGANVYGLPVGGGKLTAALSEGLVKVDPLALAVSEGRLTAAPLVKLDPAPMELTLPAGPLLSDVRISPEVSEAMLKFIAPVLSGATQSEGKFSMQLAGARIPLADAKKADIGGQLTVHSVRVVPGPMAKEWIGLVQQIETLVKQGNPLNPPAAATSPTNERQITLLSIRDQPVNFRVVEGRVYHENMEFQVEDVVMRSQGSVGLDETIQFTLTVPIQDRWIEKQRLLAGLKGQSLQIPVTGTLTRPQLDKQALANLSGQIIQGAAGQAVGNELNRALDKLLKPR